jgi:hypothetical protein
MEVVSIWKSKSNTPLQQRQKLELSSNLFIEMQTLQFVVWSAFDSNVTDACDFPL